MQSDASSIVATQNRIMTSQHLSKEEKDKLLAKMTTAFSGLDIQYLQAIYFPESSGPARIPSKFGLPSAIFTQDFQFYVNTGPNGSGLIGIAPQDTTFFPCWSGDSQIVNGGLSGRFENLRWQGQTGGYIPEKFSHARLVGCSIRIQYIGSVEEEAGFITGAHTFTSSPLLLSEEIIEDGYFKTMSKPSEGLRMVWIPKDDADMEYTPQEFKINGSKDTVMSNRNWFPYIQGVDGQGDAAPDVDELRLQVQKNVNLFDGPPILSWENLNAVEANISPSNYWGLHEGKQISQHPHLMSCYFRGMQANRDSIRVDVVRHFEAIPRQEVRDIVALRRRAHNEKTVNFVKKQSMETKLHAHDLNEAKVFEAHVKPNLPVVLHHPEVVQTTPKEDKGWWSSFKDMLPSMRTITDFTLDAAPIIGGLTGAYYGGPQGAMAGAKMGMALENGVQGVENMVGFGVQQPKLTYDAPKYRQNAIMY